MKKLLFLIALVLTSFCTQAQTYTPRWGTPPSGDNTGRTLTWRYLHKAYASSWTIVPSTYYTIVQADSLTGTLSVTATTTYAKVGDQLQFVFTSDSATAGHVVTFSTGLITSGTLTVDKNEKAAIHFIYDGSKFVATGREKQ